MTIELWVIELFTLLWSNIKSLKTAVLVKYV